MYQNTYRPVQPLQRPPIKVGGMCSLTVFKIEDVLAWPAVNPQTGIIDASIQMKPGKTMYIVQAVEKGRMFDEELKYDSTGPYMDMQIQGMVPGNTSANILTLSAAQFHQWGAIVNDRSGYYRLIGNEDSGARLTYDYTTGDATSTRKTKLSWAWQHPLPAPLYQAAIFNITIGGIIITAGSLKLLLHFQVGKAGSPMAHTQTILTDGRFASKSLLVLADGVALPCDNGDNSIDFTGSLIRHYEKTLSSNSINILGGAVQDEIIEIYEIS